MTGEPTTTTETVTTPAPETQPAQIGAAATFTQADVDRLIGERLKRDREAFQTKFLADLGIGDVDSLKTLVKSQKEAEEAKKTEIEKWQAKYAELEKQFGGLQSTVTEFKAKELKDKRSNAILNGLRDAKASDVDDLLVILEGKYADDVKAVLGEDGTVDKKAIEKLVATAKAKHDKYFTPQSPGSLSNRNGNVVSPEKERKSILADMVKNFSL